MRHLTVAFLLAFSVCFGAPAAAQIAGPNPPGPFVVDVRGAVAAIPQDAANFPTVPPGTVIPLRGFGAMVGAHIYPIDLGSMRVGVGASVLRVRGTASPGKADPGSPSVSSTASAVATGPDVDAILTAITPELSLNFGSSQGWSYVSAGMGRAYLTTGTSAFGGGLSGGAETAAQSLDSGMRTSINVGGGARWFAKAHLAFSMDVRVHFVSASNAEGPAPTAPRTSLFVASVGVGLR